MGKGWGREELTWFLTSALTSAHQCAARYVTLNPNLNRGTKRDIIQSRYAVGGRFGTVIEFNGSKFRRKGKWISRYDWMQIKQRSFLLLHPKYSCSSSAQQNLRTTLQRHIQCEVARSRVECLCDNGPGDLFKSASEALERHSGLAWQGVWAGTAL